MIRLFMSDGSQQNFGKYLIELGTDMKAGKVYQPRANVIVECSTGQAPFITLNVAFFADEKLLKDLSA